MPMKFDRGWDFEPSNKLLTMNDVREDADFLAALDERLTELLATATLPSASTTVSGAVELATTAETVSTDATRAVTPAGAFGSFLRPLNPLSGGATAPAHSLLVNVRDFGAKSDAEATAANGGVFAMFDSTAAIQAAIDYCWLRGGGTVVIPTNTTPHDAAFPNRNSAFRVSQLVMREGVFLKGDGPMMFGAYLIGNANVDMIRFDRDPSQLPGNNYILPCRISNLRLYGYPQGTAGGGIVAKDAADDTPLSLQHGVTIDHVVCMNMVEDGFTFFGGSGVSDVSQIFSFVNGGYGMRLSGSPVQAVSLVDWWADGNHGGAAVCVETTDDGYSINFVGLKAEQIENPNRGIPGTPSQPNVLHLKNVKGAVNINGMQNISSTNNAVRPGDGIVISGTYKPKSIVSAGHSIRTLPHQVNGPLPVLIRDTTPAGADITIPHETSLVVYGDNPIDFSRAKIIKGGPDLLTTGQESLSRELAGSTSTLSTGRLRMAYFTARKSETITKLRTVTGGTAAAATPTLCKVGLYTVASNGNLTLVASTANTTSLWAAIDTVYETATAASYDVVAGQRYCVIALCVTAGTAPIIGAGVAGPTGDMGADPRIAGLVDGQADLPASISAGTVQNSSNRPYVVLLP